MPSERCPLHVRRDHVCGGDFDLCGNKDAGERPCRREPAPYLFVEDKLPGRSDVPHHCPCSRRARLPLHPRTRLRATHPSCRLGRRGQRADQRHTLRSGQSQDPLRPQRHRKCRKRAVASHPRAHGPLDSDGTCHRCDANITQPRRDAAFLSDCVTGDHRYACRRAETQGAASPTRSPAGLDLHRHLSGVLESRGGGRRRCPGLAPVSARRA